MCVGVCGCFWEGVCGFGSLGWYRGMRTYRTNELTWVGLGWVKLGWVDLGYVDSHFAT